MGELFADRIYNRFQECPLVVGIDPRPELFPEELKPERIRQESGVSVESAISKSLTAFSCFIIDTISPHTGIVKFQSAFFEKYGLAGVISLQASIQYAKEKKMIVILDGKRGDIGSTAEAYSEYLSPEIRLGDEVISRKMAVDSLTVNPFLGFETIKPFLDKMRNFDSGLFVLARTSNLGMHDIQTATNSEGKSVSEAIASFISDAGEEFIGTHGISSLGAVVGGTMPESFDYFRSLMPRTLFLVPGIGAQGGKIEDLRTLFTSDGKGVLVSQSRSITYPSVPAKSSLKDVAEHIESRVVETRNALQAILA